MRGRDLVASQGDRDRMKAPPGLNDDAPWNERPAVARLPSVNLVRPFFWVFAEFRSPSDSSRGLTPLLLGDFAIVGKERPETSDC